jgi:membrane associated rhomboid family serine protease
MQSRFLPVLGIFAGGFVYSVIPHGAFGSYDVAIRAAIAGAVAGVTCLLVLKLNKRRDRSRQG